VFVRLTGCPLRCRYCDTAYAFHGGQWHDIDDIVAEVVGYGVRHVCVTGGEPLAQKRCLTCCASCAMPGWRFRWRPPVRSTWPWSTRACRECWTSRHRIRARNTATLPATCPC
jgi:hypothetical protein